MLLPYLQNCFLLVLPILLWNLMLAKKLPRGYQREVFWKDIPRIIKVPESILRVVVLVGPVLIPLNLSENHFMAIKVYLLGTLIYFLSWLLVIFWPYSKIVRHPIIFASPAITSLFWIVGIGMFCDVIYYFQFPYARAVYVSASVLFVVFHSAHAFYVRLREGDLVNGRDGRENTNER